MTNPETPASHLHGAVTTTPRPESPTALYVRLRADATEAHTLLDSIEHQLLDTRSTPLPAADHQANAHLVALLSRVTEDTFLIMKALGERINAPTAPAPAPPGEA